MRNFVVADHHVGHAATFTTFKKKDGSPLRPFATLEEMHETLVLRHNSVVTPEDKVYFLGDLALNFNKWKHIFQRMNGTKVLIKGNHDDGKITQYMEVFKDVRAYHQFDGVILSHIPIHPDSLARWGVCIHGHTHDNKVLDRDGNIDKRYFCVSVEQINYTPITIDEVKNRVGFIKNETPRGYSYV